MTSTWSARLGNVLPIGITAIVVAVVVLGMHLLTLSQQASASTAGGVVYNPRTGAYSDLAGNQVTEGEAVQGSLLSTGALCPIHQLGLFGTSASRN